MLDDTFNDSEYKIDGFLDITRSLPFKIELNFLIVKNDKQESNNKSIKIKEA